MTTKMMLRNVLRCVSPDNPRLSIAKNPPESELIGQWLIQVHTHFWLLLETLYIALNIIDHFLSAHVVSFAKLQLVGITCMFLAAIKVGEIVAPSAINFLYCADYFCPVVSSTV